MITGGILWKTDYEVNFFDIDVQHKLFVRIIERIVTEYNAKHKEQCVKLISELIRYTEFHFSSEENFMEKYQYPEIDHHKMEHKKLLVNLRERIISFDYDNINFEEVVTFLLDWFRTHTVSEDKKLAEFLNSNVV